MTHKYISIDPITYKCIRCKKILHKLGSGKQQKLSDLEKKKCLGG